MKDEASPLHRLPKHVVYEIKKRMSEHLLYYIEQISIEVVDWTNIKEWCYPNLTLFFNLNLNSSEKQYV